MRESASKRSEALSEIACDRRMESRPGAQSRCFPFDRSKAGGAGVRIHESIDVADSIYRATGPRSGGDKQIAGMGMNCQVRHGEADVPNRFDETSGSPVGEPERINGRK
jgi:hypothetical protein